MTTPTKTLRRGGQRAAEHAAAEKANRSSGSFGIWEYFSLTPPEGDDLYGESKVVRFITDEPDLIEVKQHSYITTKDAPSDLPEGKKWRPKVDATCRYTLDSEHQTLYPDCYVCDHIPTIRNGKSTKSFPQTKLWAVGVEREPVTVTQKHVDEGLAEKHQIGKNNVLFQDVMVEKKVGEETLTIPKFIVFNFGFKNFFDKLLGSNDVFGTIVDRDYKITRKGKEKDTDYIITPLDKVRDPETGNWFDLQNPDIAARYSPPGTDKEWIEILSDLVMERASDEYYGFFFDPNQDISWESRFGKPSENSDDDEKPKSSTRREETAENKQNEATIDAMRARLRKTT